VGETQDNTIDITSLISKVLKYWKLFTLCAILSIVIAFLYDRSTNPKYFITASVYVNSGDNSLDASSLLFNSQLSSSPEEVINQSIIIKSFPLLERVFEEIDFSVSYYKSNFFSKTELYNNKPFKVVLDESSSNVPYGNLLELKFKDESNFHLLLDGVEPKTEKEIYFEGDYSLGELVEINGSKFSIQAVEGLIPDLEEEYSFVFNDPKVLLYDYSSRLIVEIVQESASIIKVKIEGSQTEKLVDFLNTLLEIYVQNNLEEKNEAISNSILFMEREIELIGDSLALLGGQLEEFKSYNQINNINLEVEILVKELGDLEKQKLSLKQRSNYFDYLIKNLAIEQDYTTFKIPSTAGVEDPILTNLISQLINYTIQKKSIIKANKNNSPLLYSIESNIKSLKSEILENVNSQKNANVLALNLIQSQLDEVQKKASKLPAVEKELINLSRSYQLYENLFLLLQQNKTEAEVLRSENKADFRIIEPARLASLEPNVSRKIYYISALILGFFFASLLFIIKLLYTDKIEDVKELNNFDGAPFLGSLSNVNSWTIDYLKNNPKSKFAESLRILIGNINFILAETNGHAIKLMFNSVGSGEGKSYASTNLSILLAQMGKKVVLIDADLRSPSIEGMFDRSATVGIAQYLSGESSIGDLVISSGMKNLDLIISSTIPPNPSDLINSPRFAEMISTLEEQYDYVIIDTPPMGLVIDPFIINKHVDANIVVLREEYSKLSYIELINKHNKQNRLGNCGIILNDSKSAFKHTYSGNYYIDDNSKQTLNSKIRSFFKN